LIAGARNRPPHQEAKTRFKTWWSLVGWPVEYAAKLACITLDCTELFRSGEDADEDAAAVSTALRICGEIWKDQYFTAGAVARELACAASCDDLIIDERAIALADALGELAGTGKHLEKLTAHSIGKLFQKRLVDRPAWTKNDQTIAILRRSPGHQENKYRVELLSPGHAAHSQSFESDFADLSQNNPNNPNNPRSALPNERGQGNEGKVGNGLGNLYREKDSISGNGSTSRLRNRI
jgi:hypothetical protein